jgi:hypothetical protein
MGNINFSTQVRSIMLVTERVLALKRNSDPRSYETAECGIVSGSLYPYQSVPWPNIYWREARTRTDRGPSVNDANVAPTLGICTAAMVLFVVLRN